MRWTAVSIPLGSELSQLSVGPTGLVWAVLFNGRVIVRSGVTRDNLSGSAWLDVKPPIHANGSDATNNLKIVQVSVGKNAVWCVCNDCSVWFRRGINGEISGECEDAAIGSGWVEMIGNISMVSVANNDQVYFKVLVLRYFLTMSFTTGFRYWCCRSCSVLSVWCNKYRFYWKEMAANSTSYANKSYL